MGRSGRGELKGVGAAWSYLLRVTTRGFLGELSVGIAGVGKKVVRRLRLAALLFAPRLSARKKRRATLAQRTSQQQARAARQLRDSRHGVGPFPGGLPPSARPPQSRPSNSP